MSRKSPRFLGLLGLVTAAGAWSCGTGEAEDPHKLMAEDSEYRGVDGTTGARGTHESRSPGHADKPNETGPRASRADCAKAAASRARRVDPDLLLP